MLEVGRGRRGLRFWRGGGGGGVSWCLLAVFPVARYSLVRLSLASASRWLCRSFHVYCSGIIHSYFRSSSHRARMQWEKERRRGADAALSRKISCPCMHATPAKIDLNESRPGRGSSRACSVAFPCRPRFFECEGSILGGVLCR